MSLCQLPPVTMHSLRISMSTLTLKKKKKKKKGNGWKSVQNEIRWRTDARYQSQPLDTRTAGPRTCHAQKELNCVPKTPSWYRVLQRDHGVRSADNAQSPNSDRKVIFRSKITSRAEEGFFIALFYASKNLALTRIITGPGLVGYHGSMLFINGLGKTEKYHGSIALAKKGRIYLQTIEILPFFSIQYMHKIL